MHHNHKTPLLSPLWNRITDSRERFDLVQFDAMVVTTNALSMIDHWCQHTAVLRHRPVNPTNFAILALIAARDRVRFDHEPPLQAILTAVADIAIGANLVRSGLEPEDIAGSLNIHL